MIEQHNTVFLDSLSPNKHGVPYTQTGVMNNGHKDGVWVTTDRDGKTVSEEHYQNGQLVYSSTNKEEK